VTKRPNAGLPTSNSLLTDRMWRHSSGCQNSIDYDYITEEAKNHWMTAILWMNLKFTELWIFLQLRPIAIRNRSDGNNIKPQATKRIVKQILFSGFDSW